MQKNRDARYFEGHGGVYSGVPEGSKWRGKNIGNYSRKVKIKKTFALGLPTQIARTNESRLCPLAM